MTLKPKRKRKCKVCREWYQPFNSLQQVCGPHCAIELTEVNREKREKKQRAMMKQKEKLDRQIMRVKREKLKTRSQWLKEAQREFNKFIRTRDHGNVCISCSKPFLKKINAGHFLTVKSHPELRFHPLNCHAQCEPCNSYLSGNIIEYRKNLIKKIGQAGVDWLEGPHELQRLSIKEIKEIKQHFKDEARRIGGEKP